MFFFFKSLYEFICPYSYTIYNTCSNSCCYMFNQLSSSISSLHLLKFCEVSQTSSVTDLIPQLNYVWHSTYQIPPEDDKWHYSTTKPFHYMHWKLNVSLSVFHHIHVMNNKRIQQNYARVRLWVNMWWKMLSDYMYKYFFLKVNIIIIIIMDKVHYVKEIN